MALYSPLQFLMVQRVKNSKQMQYPHIFSCSAYLYGKCYSTDIFYYIFNKTLRFTKQIDLNRLVFLAEEWYFCQCSLKRPAYLYVKLCHVCLPLEKFLHSPTKVSGCLIRRKAVLIPCSAARHTKLDDLGLRYCVF